MPAQVDALQRHINNYFTSLIDVVVAHGGDVLRFAGDAVVCSWSLRPLDPSAEPATREAERKDVLRRAAFAACACALDLNARCAVYKIPEVQAVLKIHCGIGN